MWVKYWGQTDVMVGDCVITGDFDEKSELTMGLTPAQILLVSAVTDG
jgi:hypothetical protein